MNQGYQAGLGSAIGSVSATAAGSLLSAERACPTPRGEGNIMQRLRNLEISIDTAVGSVNQLRDRLIPAMRPSYPKEDGNSIGQAREQYCDMAEYVERLSAQLEYAHAIFADINERLEI